MSEKKKSQVPLLALDPSIQAQVDELIKNHVELAEENASGSKLSKFLVDTVEDYKYENTKKSNFVTKGYEYDPNQPRSYDGLYRHRTQLIPYYVVKQIAENDDLLAIILQTRGMQLSQFGHVQTDRHKIGYKISFRNNKVTQLPPDRREDLNKRIEIVRDLIYHCGHTEGLKNFEQKNFPQFLKEVARAALLSGFAPVEIVKNVDGSFHHFRVLDFGTIYKAPLVNYRDPKSIDQLNQAFEDLRITVESATNKYLYPVNWERLNSAAFSQGKFSWVQVANSIPIMAFTDDELICHYYYTANEWQWDGYPFSPLEAVSRDLTAHINSNTHNFSYFKNGRAARGFLTIKSDDITELELQRIRQQFYASINGAANSWRMPLFGVGQQDNIQFQPFDQVNKDQEFVFLSENLSRIILSAFGVDPAELPGFGHLARGTFSQALSENNNEYSLQVSRSAGFKPLLYDTQVMMNKILSIIDPFVAEWCVLEFVGLDIEDAQKEAVRLQQDMNIFLTYNDIMKSVEKDPVPILGNIPLNPQFLNAGQTHVTEGLFQYAFTGNKAALYDPMLNYLNSGFYFQYLALYPELLKNRERVSRTLEEYTKQLLDIFKG